MKILFIFLLLVNSSLSICPDGSISIPSSLGSKWGCVSIIPSATSFILAELQCQQNNGHLISIPSGFLNLWLGQELKLASSNKTTKFTSRFWIGIDNINGNGWQNIDDGSTPTYFDWATGETGDPIINSCVLMDTEAYWYHENCEASYSFVCEVSEVGVTTKQPSTSSTTSFTTSFTKISTQVNTKRSTPQSSVTTTSSSSTLCRSYIPFAMDTGNKAQKDFLINYFIDAVFPIDIGIAPFVYCYVYCQALQVPVDITQLKTEIQSVPDYSPSSTLSASLANIKNLGVFDYKDGIPINILSFSPLGMSMDDIAPSRKLVDDFVINGHTVTVILTNRTINITNYQQIKNLNIVLWSNPEPLTADIRKNMKCGGGNPVFRPCDTWVVFAPDRSTSLSYNDYKAQNNFIANAVGQFNHPERLLISPVSNTGINWFNPNSINYIQQTILSSSQYGTFSLNNTLNNIYNTYIEFYSPPQNTIGSLIFISDTSSPSNYEGADQTVKLLKYYGFKLTFVLLGPNVDQSKLTNYTSNFIIWKNLNNSQPDNWDNIYADAYACPN